MRGYYVADNLAKFGGFAQELLGYLQACKLQLAITTCPIAEVQQVHRDLAERRTQGKVVLLFWRESGSGSSRRLTRS